MIFLTKAEIKQLAKNAGIYMWQIAEKLEITDSTFSRKLRRPLSEADTAKVLAAIEHLSAEQATQTTNRQPKNRHKKSVHPVGNKAHAKTMIL